MKTNELEKVKEEVMELEEELDIPLGKHSSAKDEDINRIIDEGLHLERILLEDDGDEEE